MGRFSAEAMAETGITLEKQLSWHLMSNHYPAVPETMVPVAIEAIDKANEGEWDDWIQLPDGILYQGQPMSPVHAIVVELHLEHWIIESEL